MSEETSKPGIKDTIEEQSRLIIALQTRLKGAIDRNNAEDSAQFSQAMMAATQTWLLLVDAGEKMNPKPATSITQTVQPASVYQANPTRRKAP